MVPGDRFTRDLFDVCLRRHDGVRSVTTDRPIARADLYIVHEGLLDHPFPPSSQVLPYGAEHILKHPKSSHWCDVLLLPLKSREVSFRVRQFIERYPKEVEISGARIAPGVITTPHETIPVSPRVSRVLFALLHRNSQVVHRDILKTVLGFDVQSTTRIVDVTVSELRKVLTDHDLGLQIETVPQKGYRLVVGPNSTC